MMGPRKMLKTGDNRERARTSERKFWSHGYVILRKRDQPKIN
ncbi:MAG: hypothetical protein ACTS44_01955 [Candidatus Hodgkinia cicadicola]